MVIKKEVMALLKANFKTTGSITIDDKGLVSCTGMVTPKKKLKRLPVAFDKVGGSFKCGNNQLTTLEGGPISVGGDFWCYNNQLTTLQVAPTSVGGSFSCSDQQLTTLEGAPTSVGGDFLCHNNQLTTLEGGPISVGGSLLCYNNQLTTLEGGPTSVSRHYDCSNNQLTTLEGAPTSIGGSFDCHNNQLTTLEGMPTIPGILHLSYSSTLPLLRCLLAKWIHLDPENGKHKTAEEILNRYGGQGKRAMFDCQKDLEDAGFEGNARW
jgi:hypothetical protein